MTYLVSSHPCAHAPAQPALAIFRGPRPPQAALTRARTGSIVDDDASSTEGVPPEDLPEGVDDLKAVFWERFEREVSGAGVCVCGRCG